MRTRFFTLGTLLAIVLCTAEIACAQGGGGNSAFSTGFGSGGMGGGFGSGGMGGGFGSGGMGGFGSSGMGGVGSSGMGRSGFGSGGMGGFGSSGTGGGFGNSSGFGGNQNRNGQNFIGRDANDMQATFGQSNRAQTQFFNNMNRVMSRTNRKPTKSSANQNPAQPMRVEVKVAFNAPQATSDAVATTLRNRLTKILSDHHMTQPVVTVQGDTAVLVGAAASDNERQVIAQLVSLESGVRAVRNEMTVAGEATEDIAPPPGS